MNIHKINLLQQYLFILSLGDVRDKIFAALYGQFNMLNFITGMIRS